MGEKTEIAILNEDIARLLSAKRAEVIHNTEQVETFGADQRNYFEKEVSNLSAHKAQYAKDLSELDTIIETLSKIKADTQANLDRVTINLDIALTVVQLHEKADKQGLRS